MIHPATAIAAALMLSWTTAASRQEEKAQPGATLLAAVDASLNRARTLYLEFDIVNQEGGKPERKLAQAVHVKGTRRLVEFTAPDDMKGTKLLSLSPAQCYVYLPAFGKVRRIASSGPSQGFMGMAFAHDDFFVTRYSDDYAAAIQAEGTQEATLILTPKTDKVVAYAKIEMTLLKEGSLPTLLKFYDAKGELIKTETRAGYTREGDVSVPSEIRMTEAREGGTSTRLIRKTLKVDEDISDEIFTKKGLEQ